MKNYLLLIYVDETLGQNRTAGDGEKMFSEYKAFTQDIVKSGHFKGGEPLESVKTATTVRVRDGKVLRTDGPFAETKEQLGGYYLVQAKDLDEATAIAARIPGAREGSIEVRPVMPMPMPA